MDHTTIYSNLFLNNKYTRWYYKIIAKAHSSADRYTGKMYRGEYYERHHIIPKSMGGDDIYPNLVLLTAREHFICHALLWRMTGGIDKSKMAYAVKRMKGGNKYQKRYFNSRLYTKPDMSGSNNPNYGNTWNMTDDQIKANSIRNSGNNNPNFGKKMSEKQKKQISKSMKGNVISESTRIKISKANSGNGHWAFEIKRKRENCIYCNKEVASHTVNRWHNENCKQKP